MNPVAAQYCATFLKPEMLHIYRQISALRAYEPLVITRKRENADAFPFDRVIELRRPWHRELRRFWQKSLLGQPMTISRGEARRLARALEGTALLHVYFGHIAVHLLPYLRQQGARRPIVVSFHGADAGIDVKKPAHARPLREVFGLAALVLVRSQSLGDDLADLGCPREKLRVHRAGIPLGSFRFIQRQAPADGGWHLLQACRLISKKGVETSLRAFAQFSKTFPEARFTIAGEGPLAEPLKELAGALGIADRVSFPGFLPQEALRRIYEQSHLFLHPSQTGSDGNREGVPNAMLEAMATGLPVAATRHGGIPEAVENEVNGLLAPEGASDDLATAMIQLAQNPDKYAAMSEAAAQTIGEEWELQAQTRRLESFYDEATLRSS